MYIDNYIDHLLNVAVAYTARTAGKKVKDLQEPEITAAMVAELPDLLNRMVWPYSGISFGGCFIHKKPKAHYNTTSGKKVCREVGDMLVVCRQKIDGVESFNATLLQMKMHKSSSDLHKITDPSELEQLELYQNWPNFYCRRKKKDTYFDIYPKAPHPGAQYGLIRNVYGSDIEVYHSTSSKEMNLISDQSFGHFISNFVSLQNGRTITKRAQQSKDEWSRLIWYLLDISWLGAYRLSSIGHDNHLMISGDFFNLCNLMYSVNTEDQIKKMLIDGEVVEFNDEEEGISLFLIDVDENADKQYSENRRRLF